MRSILNEQLSTKVPKVALRQIEVRRLMLGEDASASRAVFVVGYQSVSQFSREHCLLYCPAREAAGQGMYKLLHKLCRQPGLRLNTMGA